MYYIYIKTVRGIRTQRVRPSIIKDNGGNRQPFLFKFLPQTSLIKMKKKKMKMCYTYHRGSVYTCIIFVGKVYTRVVTVYALRTMVVVQVIRPIRRGMIRKIQVRSTPTVFGVQQTRNNWNIKIYIIYVYSIREGGYHTNRRFYNLRKVYFFG